MDTHSIPQLIDDGPELHEAGLVHRFLMPEGPGPYPTGVLIHGRFGNDEVMWVFRRAMPRPWFLVAPRAIVAERNGSFSWLHQTLDYWPEVTDFNEAVEAMTHFLSYLPRLYNADPDRIYLMGFSQGAAVAITTAIHRPDLIRGIASLVGFAPRANSADISGRLAGKPIFMAAGTEDERIPIDQARRSAELLRQAGSDLRYREYNTGHKMTPEGMKDLQAWWREYS
jgi:phospholipase/carboxylesterase